MKVGDKIKITNKYSPRYNQVGIVAQLPKKSVDDYGRVFYDHGRVFYEDGSSQFFSYDQVELVEEANYLPVAKFKMGQIAYSKSTTEIVMILGNRTIDLKYYCFSYATETASYFREDDLGKDE